MKARGADTRFMAVNSGAQQMARTLGKDAHGIIFTQVVPFPWGATPPVVAEHKAALKAAAPSAEPSFSSLEGFISAKVLVAGLQRASARLSREDLIAGLEQLGNHDVGGFVGRLRARFAYRLHAGRHRARDRDRPLRALIDYAAALARGGRRGQTAGSTVPRHSPKPMRTAPSRLAPAAQDHRVAVLEEGARLAVRQLRSAACRRAVSSSSEPASSASGPTCVPVPSRSPGCRLQPLTVWCATICATVQ